MGTKNNPKNRAKVEKKKFNGKDVEPVYFYGVHNSTGKFMAAKYKRTYSCNYRKSNIPNCEPYENNTRYDSTIFYYV